MEMDEKRVRQVSREDRVDNITVGSLLAVVATFAGVYAFKSIEDPEWMALSLVIGGLIAALGCALLVAGVRR